MVGGIGHAAQGYEEIVEPVEVTVRSPNCAQRQTQLLAFGFEMLEQI